MRGVSHPKSWPDRWAWQTNAISTLYKLYINAIDVSGRALDKNPHNDAYGERAALFAK